MGYITNFIVYTLAMVGVIVVALLVFKNATTIGGGKSSKYLKIIDSISLGQRKNLFIVSTGKEQFLIAGDANNTCLISKIDNVEQIKTIANSTNTFKETLENLPNKKYTNTQNIGIKSSMLNETTGSSVIKNLAEIMRTK